MAYVVMAYIIMTYRVMAFRAMVCSLCSYGAVNEDIGDRRVHCAVLPGRHLA